MVWRKEVSGEGVVMAKIIRFPKTEYSEVSRKEFLEEAQAIQDEALKELEKAMWESQVEIAEDRPKVEK